MQLRKKSKEILNCICFIAWGGVEHFKDTGEEWVRTEGGGKVGRGDV